MTSTSPSAPTGLSAIAAHAGAFADLVDGADLSAVVPSCPEWRLADLVWHVTEVHDFWGHVIDHRPEPPADYTEPIRPAPEALVASLRDATACLVAALDGADPADPAWSWCDDHTVAFTLRRQTHEALIHRLDAAQAVGADLQIDDALAVDGVDELVDVFLTAPASWAVFEPGGVSLDLVDGERRWALEIGRASGTPPRRTEPVDLPALRRRTGAPATTHAELHGEVAALLRFGWGRAPLDELGLEGDRAAVDGWLEVVADALN